MNPRITVELLADRPNTLPRLVSVLDTIAFGPGPHRSDRARTI
jgi:hypothetical protein